MEKKEEIYIKFNSYVKKSLYFTRLNYLKSKKNIADSQLVNGINETRASSNNIEMFVLNKIFINEIVQQSHLNITEKFIVYNYYFLDKTDKYIGEQLGLTKQAINYKRKIIIKKLKNQTET